MTILNDTETIINVKEGATFTIGIALQSGTGYSWHYDTTSSRCQFLGKKTQSNNLTTPGGKKYEVFTFRASDDFEEQHMRFELRRSFEPDAPPANAKSVKLKRLR
jgi:predicted secreted protein